MWVAAAEESALERSLFDFLRSVRDGRPQPARALLADGETLRGLYARPHPDLLRALHHCLDAFLIELSADPTEVGPVDVPAAGLGVALALNNCLTKARQPVEAPEADGAAAKFTDALIGTLPPARGLGAALTYHAVLRGAEPALTHASGWRAVALHALVERSPLTALYALGAHTPEMLDELAAELLVGWRPAPVGPSPAWRGTDEWLAAVGALLGEERVARWVRRRWLSAEETRPACRNVGLVLEALRRRGKHRAFNLEFYESYDYFGAATGPDGARSWPTLDMIEKLLLTPGDSEAAIAVNRRGNEYFLKFRPLLMTVIDEGGVPRDYRKLSIEFVMRLRRLADYVTERQGRGITFGPAEFGA